MPHNLATRFRVLKHFKISETGWVIHRSKRADVTNPIGKGCVLYDPWYRSWVSDPKYGSKYSSPDPKKVLVVYSFLDDSEGVDSEKHIEKMTFFRRFYSASHDPVVSVPN